MLDAEVSLQQGVTATITAIPHSPRFRRQTAAPAPQQVQSGDAKRCYNSFEPN
jgi:hypothetical protein